MKATILAFFGLFFVLSNFAYCQSERQSWTVTGSNLGDIVAVIMIVFIFAGLWRLLNISDNSGNRKEK